MLIGQNRLLDTITQQIKDNIFPHFCLLVGPEGSGKKTLAKEIAKLLNAMPYIVEPGIDNIRKMIIDCYTVKSSILYLIGDGDNLSNEAKNALLKITEEPPNDAYIIMCLESIGNTLETIKSRASVYNMDYYTTDEIMQYFKANYCFSDWDDKDVPKVKYIIKSVCETPGEVKKLVESDPIEFFNYVELTVANIKDVSWANAFKSANRLSLKKDAEGYDLKLFLKAFMSVCIVALGVSTKQKALEYADMSFVTSKALQELGIRGISKQMLFDNWIINLREKIS